MSLRARNKRFQQTVRAMPMRSRILLGVAIFTTFMALSLWGASLSLAPGFWTRVVASALFSGVIGLGYAAVGFGYRVMLPVVIVVNILGSVLMARWMPVRQPSAMSLQQVRQAETRLDVLGTVRIVISLVAYTSFIAVLRLEGERSFGAHTEIRLAREIHASLVPLTRGRAGDLEWYGVSHPSGEVGGDLVDVVSDRPSAWTACVADVSGHGVAAGVLMGMFKTALRSAYRVSAEPSRVLSEVNDVIGPLKQSNMFVTAAMLGWSEPNTLSFVLAGHPSLVHVDGATGRARWIGESQVAIGFKDDVDYRSDTIEVAAGDLVAVVTDGLIEVFDRRQHELGADGLLRIVEGAARQSRLSEAADEIFAGCAKYGAQTDDQSLLLVSRAGRAISKES